MFSVQELVQATRGTLLQGSLKATVKGVSIDSRKVKKGELFIAIKGDIFDGHDFISHVMANGIKVLIVHKHVDVNDPKVSVILVKDTVKALGDVARFHRLKFKIPVIALTGSAGKTTTKEMLAAVLEQKYNVLKNEGTQNNHIGVPLTLLKLKSAHDIVVLECGTNQPGDIPWLADVARPDAALFTNIGESHLEKLKTPEGVLKEKWALVSFMKPKSPVFINADDKRLLAQVSKAKHLKIITYSIERKSDYKAGHIVLKEGSLKCTIAGKIIELNSCGMNNVYNALSVFACGRQFGVPAADISKALKSFKFPRGRGQILKLGTGWMIDDTYNANPVSMRSALQTLDALTTDGQKIFVAADMLELGAKAKSLHQEVGKSVAKSSANVLITVGKLAKFIALEARRQSKGLNVFACQDIEEAQKCMAKVFHNGDAVLLKGSRRMKMEQMVEFLLASPGKVR
jgi:UDP-N-acetylmuramoyl-tripeptide--D-alanyl-D-alanine ligase